MFLANVWQINLWQIFISKIDCVDFILPKNKFWGKMNLSGYNEHKRQIIIDEGEARVNKIKTKVTEGKRLLCRTSEYNKYERAIENRCSVYPWRTT